MRGRRPTPTALKLLHGNPGRRPLNAHEPTAAPIEPKDRMPEEVASDELAAAEWRRVIKTLARGHVQTVDRATLAAYAVKYSQWKRLEAEAARHAFLIKSPSGYPIPNPAVGMANKACALMLRLAVELGITPSSRSRIAAVDDGRASGPVDDFTAFQRRRGRL